MFIYLCINAVLRVPTLERSRFGTRTIQTVSYEIMTQKPQINKWARKAQEIFAVWLINDEFAKRPILILNNPIKLHEK